MDATYLYFAHARQQPFAPLILDRKVAAAFGRADPPWVIGTHGWNAATYDRYLARAHSLAAQYGTTVDVIEHGLFTGRI